MSNIEDDVKIVKRYLRNSSYKESDSDFFKNGGWEMVDLEIPKAMANILSEREQDKAKIKELENRLRDINTYILINGIDEPLKTATQIKVENQQQYIIQEKINLLKKKLENSIPKQKVKDILNEIQEEYDKVQEQFDCIWNKKSKDNYDRYKLQELSAMQQELGFILGKFEKLLEEGE